METQPQEQKHELNRETENGMKLLLLISLNFFSYASMSIDV